MIQSLSNDPLALSAMQLAHAGGAEGPHEAEHDGDSDDGGAAARTTGPGMAAMLPDHVGNTINIWA